MFEMLVMLVQFRLVTHRPVHVSRISFSFVTRERTVVDTGKRMFQLYVPLIQLYYRDMRETLVTCVFRFRRDQQ